MTDDPKSVLDFEVGGRNVGETLDEAIRRGSVVERPDGRLTFRRDPQARGPRDNNFVSKRGPRPRRCVYLNQFLFKQVYAEAQVPFGCHDCYKIRIVTRSLRAMLAAQAIAAATDFSCKSGPEADNPENPHLYCSYIYFYGLDEARGAYAGLREQLDAHPDLGPDVVMVIKRGCTNYEHKLGPSDRYTFDPRQEAAEAYLLARFDEERPPRVISKAVEAQLRLMRLTRIAYRIGDDTYKDFTDGKPLLPVAVTYAPEEPAAKT
jgi:hypothetical protein